MKNRDQTSSLVWMFTGIPVCLISYGLNLGDWQKPGPGFLPFLAALVLTILSAIVFLQATLKGSKETARGFVLFRNWKIPATMGVLFAYAYFIDLIGFLVSTYLLFIFLLWGVERLKGWKAFGLSLLFTVVGYLLFQVWLKVPMPIGFLG